MEGVVTERSFWSGKRVFLTGHTGFKGTWLALWLREMGADVRGYALAPEAVSMHRQTEAVRDISGTTADVRNIDAVRTAMRAADPHIVFHLAAQPLVRASYTSPVETFGVNVMGTAHVLDAAREMPALRAVVAITTDKVYENHEWDWAYRETDALGGHDPYSTSKACAELVCMSWRKSFGADVPWRLATVRAGNVIGGGDWAADRLVPDMIRAAMAGSEASIRNPMSIRPWQHVLDPLSGYLDVARRLSLGEHLPNEWNFGPDVGTEGSVRTVADLVARAWNAQGAGFRWVQDSGAHPHESRSLSLDSTRAKVRLGWRPRLDLEGAVEWTVRWYREVASGRSARDITLEQIAAYEALEKDD